MAKAIVTKDPEIEAISLVYAALNGLEPSSQQRVLDYVAGKLGLRVGRQQREEEPPSDDDAQQPSRRSDGENLTDSDSSDLDGINSVAKKWMQRSGLSAKRLSSIFSIGGDEIDLIAKKVPGKTKRDRMRSVLLLKAIAAYLASGAPRVSYEQVKEACLHYDAFDNTNVSRYLKSMAAEISGTKQSGFTLTARGTAAATDMVRELSTGTQD